MAFDWRNDCTALVYDWENHQLDMCLKSLTSVAGGPADPPMGEVRRNRWPCDTSSDVIVRSKRRYLLQETVVEAGAAPTDPPIVTTYTDPMVVVDVPDWMHVSRRHMVVNHPSVDEDNGDPTPCRTIIADLLNLGYTVPFPTSTRIRADYADFIRRAREKALFLGHTSMRLGVDADMMMDVVGRSMAELRNSMGVFLSEYDEVHMPARPPLQEVEGFLVVPPAPSKAPACAVCLELVIGSWKVAVTKCRHEFHLACIWRWLEESCQCPICRTTLEGTDVRLCISYACPRPVLFS